MISESTLKEGLNSILNVTQLSGLGERYQGKVRDCYMKGDERILVTSDRLSCFDKNVTTIPFKGQVLNGITAKWFSMTRDIIENAVIDLPDPNVMVARNCDLVPFEMIVRGYIAGSAWRSYAKGEMTSGVAFPEGLKEFQKLPAPVITPSTKATDGGHDLSVSEEYILSSGKVEKVIWEQMKEAALALFERGSKFAEERGLILVDTKYEFGLFKGKLMVIDEIHTLDCSRYWIQSSYSERIGRGEAPEMLDKEPVRRWLISQGYMGEGPVPHFTDEYRLEISQHYIRSYELLLGESFNAVLGDPYSRIEMNLQKYMR